MPRLVSDLVADFLQWAEAALAPATVNAYAHQLRAFCRSAGKVDLRKLTAAHLTRWAKNWHQAQAVVRAFNWAATEAKTIKSNPFAAVKLPPRNERRRILLPRQMQEFLRAASPAARLFLLALRETMARPQEIRAADLDDLRSEDPDVELDDALAGGQALIVLRDYKDRKRRKQSNKPRVILVSRRLGRAILRARRRPSPATGRLFVNTVGRPWTNNAVRCMLRRIRRRIDVAPDKFGENVVAYTFRHSGATYAASKGIVDRVLAEVLGHTETRTTSRYQHLQVSHLREAMSRLEPAAKRRKVG
jgi:integrase